MAVLRARTARKKPLTAGNFLAGGPVGGDCYAHAYSNPAASAPIPCASNKRRPRNVGDSVPDSRPCRMPTIRRSRTRLRPGPHVLPWASRGRAPPAGPEVAADRGDGGTPARPLPRPRAGRHRLRPGDGRDHPAAFAFGDEPRSAPRGQLPSGRPVRPRARLRHVPSLRRLAEGGRGGHPGPRPGPAGRLRHARWRAAPRQPRSATGPRRPRSHPQASAAAHRHAEADATGHSRLIGSARQLEALLRSLPVSDVRVRRSAGGVAIRFQATRAVAPAPG